METATNTVGALTEVRSRFRWLRAIGTLFGSCRYAPWLALLAVALSGVAMALEGISILMTLPFLEKLAGADGRRTLGVIPIDVLDRWLAGFSSRQQLLIVGLTIGIAVLIRGLLLYAGRLLRIWLGRRMADVHRVRLHSAVLSAQYAVVSAYPHGHFQALLHAEAKRIGSLATQMIGLVDIGIVTAVVLSLMLFMSPPLTASVFVLLAILGIPLSYCFRWIHRTGFARTEGRIALMNYLAELMPFLRSVHILNAGPVETERFRQRYHAIFADDFSLHKVSGLIGPAYQVVGTIGVLATIFLAMAMTPTGAHIGWVIPFVVLFARMLPVLNSVNATISGLEDGFASFERITQEIAFLEGHRIVDGQIRFPSRFRRLDLRAVSFEYEAGHPVLNEVSLSIKRGRHIGIVGPSGCGKSTLCLLLARLYQPIKGEILVDGVPFAAFKTAELRQAVGLVEQTTVLLNDSVMENIRYGKPAASDDDVREAARKAHADRFIRDLPRGYDTNVGNLGAAISGGERQRIAIARALLREPQILILDEATSGVDSVNEAMIKAMINELKQDTTIVSVAHRLSTIRDADEIYFLANGRVICSGTFSELFEASSDFQNYVRAQSLFERNAG